MLRNDTSDPVLLIPAGPVGWETPAGSPEGSFVAEAAIPLNRGEITGFSGVSGVGKSVFFRTLVAYCQRGDGRAPDGRRRPKRVAFVPQELPLLPECTLNLNARRLSRGSSLREVLSEVPPSLSEALSDRGACSPASMSGGERRVFSLVCAVLSRPDLLVLDETLVSVDETRLLWALHYLREAVEEGNVGAVAIAAHDLRVLDACDSVVAVSHGNQGSRKLGEPVRQVPEAPDRESGTSAAAHHKAPESIESGRTLLWPLGRAAVGGAVALGALVLLLLSPRFKPGGASVVIPTAQDLVKTAWTLRDPLLQEGLWTFGLAGAALGVASGVSLAFWFVVGLTERSRKFGLSTWVALQAIPVVILSPFLVIFGGLQGAILELTIATFIAVFPLGLMGARIMQATPGDLLLAHGASSPSSRFLLSMQYSWGHLVRAFVATSPLAAVGAVVAEYLLGYRGLGMLVQVSLVGTLKMTVPFVYTVGCVLVALGILLAATLVGSAVLPRDVVVD